MMQLADLLQERGVPPVNVAGLTDDSRAVNVGDAFVAVAGDSADGHHFAAEAERRGATVILSERPVAGVSIPVVLVAALRQRRGALAARFYGEPSRSLRCIGVTGTNGKTSIAHYVADMACTLGRRTAYMGTIGRGAPGALQASRLTTDGAIDLQRHLRAFVDDGYRQVALEVSSHALSQKRVAEVEFDTAVFSNLTRDHLDYHLTEQAYGEAKLSLFRFPSLSSVVVNMDDAFAGRILDGLRPAVTRLGYGRHADISWHDLRYGSQGVQGRWHTPWGNADMELPVAGEFSVANVAAAMGALCAAGAAFEDVVRASSRLRPVPGRMEFFSVPGRPTVVVDYAHTPDALGKVLESLRRHAAGGLICVFGCGGDRDPGKRPLMARAAERHADVVWLTSDNPRSEDPRKIIDDAAAGFTGAACVHRCENRADAIAAAVAGARPGDLVVVAGKGHEDYQEISGVRLPHDDRQLVAELLGGAG